MPDDDVASSLSDLERKLEALERELHAGRTASGGSHAPGVGAAHVRGNGHAEAATESPFAAALAAPELPPAPDLAPPPAPRPAASGPVHAHVATPPAPPRSAGAEPPEPDAETPPALAADAARLIGDARAELGGLHAHLDELVRFREQLERSAAELMAEYDRLIGVLRAAAEHEQAAAGLAAAVDAIVLDGMLTVDAGPFEDIAELARFEQALNAVPGVRDVHVRTLERSRALVDVILGEPVAFGSALRKASAQSVAVTRAVPGHVTVEMA
jgi:hypothetical protein